MSIANAFYSHVNYSVTKMKEKSQCPSLPFYSHVNYSVTKIEILNDEFVHMFYSHVNYSVTKMAGRFPDASMRFTVT